MPKLYTHLPYRLHGVPCGVHITSHTPYRPGYLTGPPGDCFPDQGEEWEFVLLDRHGYPAPWLERMAGPAEREAISEALSRSLADDSPY